MQDTTQIDILPVHTLAQIEIIENLAREIIPDFYQALIPYEHSVFFVEKHQTVQAIQQQIEEGFEYYLLLYETKIVGYLGIQLRAKTLLLSKLYILKEFRGYKIGETAMNLINQKAVERQVSKIELIVNQKNLKAIEFYQRNGFAISKNLVHTLENGYMVEDYKMTKVVSS